MAKDRESRALSKPSGKRAGGQALSDEERTLWEHAARGLKPLRGKKLRVSDAREDLSRGTAASPREPEKGKAQSGTRRTERHPAKPEKVTAPPPLSDVDRRKARRIGTGRIDIEARIDLHGMRQSEAHAALRRFLKAAYAAERRWMLVITGKGTALRRGVEEETEAASGYGEAERGVLRRNVPRWLAEPELRSIVVGYTAAAIRHGGAGALYVQLRRRNRSKTP